MIVFAKESFDKVWVDTQDLIRAHWDEISERKDVLRLDPNVMEYRKLEAAGYLHILTARDDGKLVGYYPALVKSNLHYQSVIVGADDIYFIHPAYRKSKLGFRLFLEAEKMLRELKARVSVVKAKIKHDHPEFFARLGYEPIERVYWKFLDDSNAPGDTSGIC